MAKREASLGASNREIDAAMKMEEQKRKENMSYQSSLKDEIKRMIPVRGLSIIDKKLKTFIEGDSPRKKAVPLSLQKAASKSFRA